MSEAVETTDKLEELISEQKKQLETLKKVQLIQGVALAVFLLIFAVGVIYLNTQVQRATKNLPQLVDTATVALTETSEDIQELVRQVEQVDFKELNDTIQEAGESISAVDVEALNKSIRQLEAVVDKLANFFGITS